MAISVSVSSQTTSNKKAIWAWVVSEKHNKFGSTQTESTVIAELIGIYSALTTIPKHHDIVIRTQHKSVADLINDFSKLTKNPVVLQVRKIMDERVGIVRAVITSQASVTESDKRCHKMTLVLSRKYQQKAPAKTTISVSPAIKAAPVRKRKQSREVLITGLEDDYDAPVISVTSNEVKHKPVMCESCDMPINPLTKECGCSN